MQITFLRHGETEHNAEGRWQGHAAGRLSELGREQAVLVGERLAGRAFDRVIVSDLERTRQTAALAGFNATPDEVWREIDVGDWAGRPHTEVAESDGGALSAMRRGEDVKLGGGESVRQFTARVKEAFDDLASAMEEDERVLVITHGGVIWALAASHWGLPFPNPKMSSVSNTSLTTFDKWFGRWHLSTYNDAGHLGALHGVDEHDLAADERLVTLVRHGQTDANVQQIWQGQSDWPLNEMGRRQAELLAKWFGPRDPVVASPSLRAAETGAALNGGHPATHAGLMEMFMGSWENLTTEQIEAGWPELYATMRFGDGDFRRGGDGERAADLTDRMRRAVEEILANHDDDQVTIVSHGSAIRSYVVSIFGDDYLRWRSTGIVPNTGLAHVVVGLKRTRLHAYGIAPHLEQVEL